MHSEDSDQPTHIHTLTRIFTECMAKDTTFVRAVSEDSTLTVDVQIELSFLGAHVRSYVFSCCDSNQYFIPWQTYLSVLLQVEYL